MQRHIGNACYLLAHGHLLTAEILSGDTSALSLAAMVEYLTRNNTIEVVSHIVPELGAELIPGHLFGDIEIDNEYPKLRIISLKQKDFSSINFPLTNERGIEIIKDYIKNLRVPCQVCDLFLLSLSY